ncbi:MAG: hypothetical protein K8Q97_03250 [Candidatus Andersenbacteria bacterium]|nr:hypothetical protein [Candidatus Andersenbacteria bacterium]
MEEGITIRTMQDDVAGLKKQQLSAAGISGKTLKKELGPMPKKNPAKKGILVGGIILLFCVIGAGAWFGYSTFLSKGDVAMNSASPLPITEVIPSDVVAVVAYDASSDANRAVISSYWSNGGDASQVFKNADPTTLLTSTDAQSVYYFVLANNSTPFTVIPKTSQTTKYLQEGQGIKYAEKGGWYIVHELTIDDYTADIDRGNYSNNPNASLLPGSGFVARYIINSSLIPQLLSLPANLGIDRQQIVFDVNQVSGDGAVQGEYALSEIAVPEGVTPDTTQLTALVPGDASFLRVGENFSNDIAEFQQTHSVFDTHIFSEPAIQQYIAKLSTPYALYVRTGVDGVPDTGLIIQIPDTLKPHKGYSDPIIEQLLTSFAPFVTGRALGSQIVFADGSYNAIPIRYTNLEGQTSALDYTIGDNYILIASSREGMQALGAMALGTGSAMVSNSPWNTLLQKAKSFVPYNMIAGTIADPAMLSLIPAGQLHSQASIIVSTKGDNTGIHTHATVEFIK